MGEQAREQRSGLGQHGAIVAVKSIHTLIFALVSTCVLHVFWAGVRGRPNRWTGPAIVVVLAESAVFVGNGRRARYEPWRRTWGPRAGR